MSDRQRAWLAKIAANKKKSWVVGFFEEEADIDVHMDRTVIKTLKDYEAE